MELLDRNLLTYTFGVALVLKLLYDLASTLDMRNRMNQVIIVLGRYSLICYIMQIIFLHALSQWLGKQKWGMGVETITIFILTNVCLWGTCELIIGMRARFPLLDRSYKLIFS